MSRIVLQSAEILKPLQVTAGKLRDDAVYAFERDFSMLVHTNRGDYLWQVGEGYISNCGSIPWLGQKILRVKSYNPDNPLQNAFFFFHDDLYQKKDMKSLIAKTPMHFAAAAFAKLGALVSRHRQSTSS